MNEKAVQFFNKKARREALQWLAFRHFIWNTPDEKKLARGGTYARYYRSLVAAHEVHILRARKATRKEQRTKIDNRALFFRETLARLGSPIPVVAVEQSSRQPEKQMEKVATEGTSPKPVALAVKPSGPRRGEVGHTDRLAAGSVKVEASKYVGMAPELVFTPDKKRPKLKPDETIDILNATRWDITRVPSTGMRHATPDWYNEYWGFICLGDGDDKYADILDHILGLIDGFEACSSDYHPVIQRLWKECVAGILAQLRGQSCSETSEAWRAGYNADVNGLSADQWSESEGRFIDSEEKVS